MDVAYTTDGADDFTEKGETRVFGLGIGVFLIFFFSLISFLVCLIGATTPRPGLVRSFAKDSDVKNSHCITLFTASSRHRDNELGKMLFYMSA